jgi:tetratricopeptide (TPR) repeat protein
MSPEQAEVNQLDIDTRSDIYSLGVVLYELLTGSTPLDRKRLKEAAFAEVLRIIREEEPPRPSTRLSHSSDSLPSVSAQRQMEPAKLTRLVRGELDWIVMKALEKDRNRRYETANGFAMDVQRYLADESVLACPPSVAYRLRKFARRNRGGLAVAALVLFFLVLVGSGAGWVWRDRAARATEQANHLERAIERAELLHREGKRGEALAALERAQLLAREAEPAPPMAERIASLQQLLEAEGRDEVFVAQFAAIRREVQTEVDVEKSAFREMEGYPKLREALQQYGIGLDVTPVSDAVAHIQKRPAAVRSVVVVALDECLWYAPQEDSGRRKWLTDVLQQADSDPWRNKVRRAWKQPATLEAFVRDIDVRQQPPNFLVLVVRALPSKSSSHLDLARRVQFAHAGDFWANHQLGWDLDHAGMFAEAIRYYTVALALRPDNPGVLLNRSVALRLTGELEAAIADVQRAIELNPKYAPAFNSLGNILCDQKKMDEAIAAYRKAIEINGKNAKAHENLGMALAKQKKLPEAIAALRKAIDLDPKFAKAYNDLGFVLCEELREYDKAIECFRAAIKLDPKYAHAYNNLGSALYQQGKLDEAIANFRKAIDLNPKHPDAHSNLGLSLFRQNKLNEAIAVLRKAIDLNPKQPDTHSNLGDALNAQKKLDEAIAAYRMAIELQPTHPRAYRGLGDALYAQNKLDPAIDAYRKAIELDPKDVDAHNKLGCSLHAQNKLEEAIAAYRKAIELRPNHPWAYCNLGMALRNQNRLDQAIDAYRKAIEVNPKHVDAHINLGCALFDQNRLDEAITIFRKAIDLNPKHRVAYYNLGSALKKQNKLDEAIAAYRKAIELDPRSKNAADAYFQIGKALEKQGKLDEAIASYRKTIELDPKSAAAHGQLAWLLTTCREVKLRDAQHGLEAARIAVELSPQSSFAWGVLGWAHYRVGDWKASIEALEKSCALEDDPKGGDAAQWFFLAMAHWQLGEKVKARAWYDRAVGWMDKNKPEDELLRRLRAEASQLLELKERM